MSTGAGRWRRPLSAAASEPAWLGRRVGPSSIGLAGPASDTPASQGLIELAGSAALEPCELAESVEAECAWSALVRVLTEKRRARSLAVGEIGRAHV